MSRVRFYWLLELEAGGVLYRYATEDLEVTTAAGEVLVYRQALPEDLELAQGDAEVDIEIVDPAVDWPVVGALLDGAGVVLRRWRQGTALERAETYAKGTVTDPEWGASFEPVAWTIRAVEDLPPMPDPEARVSALTTNEEDGVTEIPIGQSGMYYPTIFGFPGYLVREYFGGLLVTRECVVPCPMRVLFRAAADASDSQIVVSADAGAHLPDTVRMREDESGVETETGGHLTVVSTTDELGRSIGVATLSDFRLFSLPDDGPVYLAAFAPDDGGVPAPRSAYDVICYVLKRWGGNSVDWSRIPEIRDHIAGYLVDFWINAHVEGGVWTWLVEVLGVADVESTTALGLPIAIRTSAEGRYFVPLRYTVDPVRTVRTIDISRGEASRVSSVRVIGAPTNAVQVNYCTDGFLQAYAGELRGTPAFLAQNLVSPVSLTSVAPSSVASSSVARYGSRFTTLDAHWTWDLGTALRLAHDRLERDALPWRSVQYRVPEEWGLREGDQVELVDQEVALDELAIVDGPPHIGVDGMTVSLRMPGRL